MLKILNTIRFVACENADGLMGFYYSHDGYWNSGGERAGTITEAECANTCMGRASCVAFSTYATGYPARCFHYSNKADLVSSNKGIWYASKAYIKCLGTDV